MIYYNFDIFGMPGYIGTPIIHNAGEMLIFSTYVFITYIFGPGLFGLFLYSQYAEYKRYLLANKIQSEPEQKPGEVIWDPLTDSSLLYSLPPLESLPALEEHSILEQEQSSISE